MVSFYSSLAFWGFLLTLVGILINVLMQVLKVPKQSGTKINWWPLLPLGLALIATLFNRYANIGQSELNNQKVDSLQSHIAIDSVKQARSDSTIDSLKQALSTSKRDINTIKNFMPPSFKESNSKALYQNGIFVGVYDSCRIEKTNKRVFFGTISNSNNLDLAKPIIFSKFRLQFVGAETMIGLDSGRPSEGRIIKGAVFKILGFK